MTGIRRQYQAVLIALQFLTILPVRPDYRDTPLHVSLPWYPFVGLLIGLLLAALSRLLGGIEPVLAAALLLVIWVVVTGGLHLDGLADTTDAWIGGMGDRERTLIIMKDPRSGPMGVTALVLVLLLKLGSLQVLVQQSGWLVLLWIPVLARSVVMIFLTVMPYVRAGGLGEALSVEGNTRAVLLSLAAALALMTFTTGWRGVVLALVTAILAAAMSYALMRRLGGVTGDTLGAATEMTEAVLLLTAALLPESLLL